MHFSLQITVFKVLTGKGRDSYIHSFNMYSSQYIYIISMHTFQGKTSLLYTTNHVCKSFRSIYHSTQLVRTNFKVSIALLYATNHVCKSVPNCIG